MRGRTFEEFAIDEEIVSGSRTVTEDDVVNFARLLKVPGMYSWGFNDETCPPTSMYAAYNVISATKELFIAQETGHWTYPEQTEKLNSWLVTKLKGL